MLSGIVSTLLGQGLAAGDARARRARAWPGGRRLAEQLGSVGYLAGDLAAEPGAFMAVLVRRRSPVITSQDGICCYMEAMKLRHAAAVATVGWYLMMPPGARPRR